MLAQAIQNGLDKRSDRLISGWKVIKRERLEEDEKTGKLIEKSFKGPVGQ